MTWLVCSSLHWRHNDHGCVSNNQHRGCLLNRLFRRRWKKTSKLRVTGLCVGNSPGPVNSPHKGPITRKMFPFHDVIMYSTKFYVPIAKDSQMMSWHVTFPYCWPFVRGTIGHSWFCFTKGPQCSDALNVTTWCFRNINLNRLVNKQSSHGHLVYIIALMGHHCNATIKARVALHKNAYSIWMERPQKVV